MYTHPDDLQVTLGRNLARLRIQRGVSQKELARRANIGVSSLQRVEAGRGGQIATLVRAVKALDADAWLDALAPRVTVSPLDVVRGQVSERRRVYAPRVRGAQADGSA